MVATTEPTEGKKMTGFQDVLNAMDQGEVLGASVWWTTGMSNSAMVARAFEACGLAVPKVPGSKTFFMRAVNRISNLKDIDENHLLRKVDKDGKKWTVVHERPSDDTGKEHGEDLAYDPCVGKFEFDDMTGMINVIKDHPIVQRVLAEFQKISMQYGSVDLARYVVAAIMEFDPIRLRRTGGVYFVPNKNGRLGNLKVLAEALNAVSPNFLYVLPVAKTTGACMSIHKVAIEDINADMDELAEEVEKLHEKSKTETVTEGTLERRIEKILKLREKMVVYEVILGASMDNVRDRAKQVEKGIRDFASEVSRSKSEPTA